MEIRYEGYMVDVGYRGRKVQRVQCGKRGQVN